MNMSTWQQIKAEYEQGISKSTLARIHGVSRQAIQQRAHKEQWIASPLASPQPLLAGVQETIVTDNLVDRALADLAIHLTDDPQKAKLQLNQHKLFADSFSQYMKAKLLTPEQETAQQGVDWSMFTEQEL